MMRRRRAFLIVNGPERGRERLAVLVNRERVESELVGEPDAGIQELHVALSKDRKIAEGQAQRANGIPHSQEIDVDRLASI